MEFGQDPLVVLRLGRWDFLWWSTMAMRAQEARDARTQVINSNLAVEIVNNLPRAFRSK